MRVKGKIRSWNDDKDYGFVALLDGNKQIFIHISALSNRKRQPELNDVVAYSMSSDTQGRLRAANATLAGDKLIKKAPKKSSKTAIPFAVLFLAAMGLSALTANTSPFLAIGYAGLSLITFLAYAFDKSAARRGAWRTSEGTLLFLGLAGGWPGALIAQETRRHKSKKASFRTVFWVTVVLNCVALTWLHTESGQAAMSGLLV